MRIDNKLRKYLLEDEEYKTNEHFEKVEVAVEALESFIEMVECKEVTDNEKCKQLCDDMERCITEYIKNISSILVG